MGRKRPVGQRIAREIKRIRRDITRMTADRLIVWRVRRMAIRRGTKAHGLSTPLVVSLTSFDKRFGTLSLSLKCLLSQTVRPDALVLWLTDADDAKLPAEIRALEGHGLEIRRCPDLQSYKKIIHALRAFPGPAIVTADDDVYYPPRWLEMLVEGARAHPGDVICHRGHLVSLDHEGRPKPYSSWTIDTPETGPSPLIFPTGVGGVLYPPGVFATAITDEALFLALAPRADDIWLYWMAAMNGAVVRRTDGRRRVVEWPGSQVVSLWSYNIPPAHGNDDQIAAMLAHFGSPWPASVKD